MDLLRFVLGGILPYLAVAVFLAAMVYRVHVWRKLPAPSMTLFPSPEGTKATAVNTAKEAFFFSSLFKGDRPLWVFAWGFHVVLALIFLGHLRVVTNVDSVLMAMGMSEAGIQGMSGGVGGAAGVVILFTAVVLLVRRFTISRVKIGAILITGNIMRFSPEHFDLGLTRDYFANLATFNSPGSAEVLSHNVFLVHMTLAFGLLIYIPFSKILHFGGIFFTHQLIRKQ
jgi:nitrate reductase gamma subunit